MSAEAWYLDSSALVKAVIEEPESPQLMKWLADKEQLVACELIRVETVRAVRVSDPDSVPRARQALATLTVIRLDDSIYEVAADLTPTSLRSLDALHLAAALSLGPDLRGLVTYDMGMTKAATDLGLPVEAPGRTGQAQP
jgi:predicted nucleic acid-binding protein